MHAMSGLHVHTGAQYFTQLAKLNVKLGLLVYWLVMLLIPYQTVYLPNPDRGPQSPV